jgi:quinol monooxygenase YgiN
MSDKDDNKGSEAEAETPFAQDLLDLLSDDPDDDGKIGNQNSRAIVNNDVQTVLSGPNAGRYFCKVLLQPRQEVCQVHTQKLKKLFDHNYSEAGNLMGVGLVPLLDSYDADEHEDQDQDQYEYLLALSCWRSSQHFNQYIENFDSPKYIDYGNLECFPKMTFWESFHDVKPPHEMHHWRHPRKYARRRGNNTQTTTPNSTQQPQSSQIDERSINKKADADCSGHDPKSLVVCVTTFNIDNSNSSDEDKQQLLKSIVCQFLCLLADASRLEEGNIVYEVFATAQDAMGEESSGDFVLYGEWTSKRHYEAHKETRHYQAFVTKAVQKFLPEASSLDIKLWRYHKLYF